MADINQIITLGIGTPSSIKHFILGGLNIAPDIYRVPVEEYFPWQRPVAEITSTPPGSPVKGDRYLVGAAATGAWSGHDDDVAWFNGAEWKFDTPAEGWGVFNIDDSTLYFFIAGVWTAYP